jgi:membrane fusion protein
MSLFRAETEQARATAWLGRVVLVRPLSFSLMTAIALAMASVVGAYFVLGDYTRKARVVGTLAPADGLVKVVTQQPGRVQDLGIVEGVEVERHELLLSVVDARASEAVPQPGTAYTRGVQERRRALVQQHAYIEAAMRTEHAGFAQRRAGIERELEQLEREIGGQEGRLRLAERSLDRLRELREVGFVSALALDREAESSLEHQGRLQSMRRTRLALQRERDALDFESSSARSRAQAQLEGMQIQRAVLEQERIERELQHRIDIIAPSRGIVSTVLVEPGQAVSAGTTLATIIPAGAPLEAHLFAPSRAIGFVQPGQEVLLRYPAYPHQKFGAYRGRITSISRSATPPGELGFSPADGSREPLYRIKVDLAAQEIEAYGRAEPLKAGMQVEADILLDRRRLIEWIFEPLLSLSGRA